MASFSAGTTFTDGVANDVTAAKLAALVNAATPTSGLIQDRTAETTIDVNDTLLVGDASDSNNLKRMTVANFAGTLPTATITSGTITALNSTTGTIATLNSTTGTIATLNSTTGTIGNFSTTLAGDFTISSGTSTLGTTGVTAGTYGGATSVPVLTLDTKGRVTTASTSAITTGFTGFRNRIINGDMRIDQRNAGASQTFTAAAALAYSVDRFYGYCTGANATGARVAGTAPNEFAYRFTGAASVTAIGFGTRLETTNTTDLAGSTATLSVQLANSLLTSVTWTAFYATTADAFGTLASPTRTQIATGTFTVTSTLTTYSAQISVPSAATTGIEIVFTVGAQISGTWTIDNVQLEAGSNATEFERRPIGTELALCQRYYYRIGALASQDTFGIAIAESATGGVVIGNFPVTLRTSPSALEQSGTASDYVIRTGGNSRASSAVPIFDSGTNENIWHILTTVASGQTAGQGGFLRAGAVVTAYLGWSAEL